MVGYLVKGAGLRL
uniref:Uncharacterized protein n=1 Tax=Arundo donax TaxID=35708 RepID=A0A0A9B6E0_ARUDO